MTERLRQALVKRLEHVSANSIAREARIDWHSLKRFVDGHGLRTDQLDKLATVLGMELVPTKRKPRSSS